MAAEVRVGVPVNFSSKFIDKLNEELMEKAILVKNNNSQISSLDIFAYKILEVNGLLKDKT